MQHYQFSKRLKLALESADSPSATISSPNGGTEEIATGVVPYYVEDELMAASDTADEIEAVVNEGDTLGNAKVQLESLNAALESVKGCFTPYEVRCTALALEAIAGRWGGEGIPMPAMEAFTNPNSSRQAVISLEATVKEVVAQILKHLKELWEKFKALIKKFIDHLANVFDNGMKKARALKKQIDEGKFIPGKTNEKIAIDAQIPAITVDGKIMTIAQLRMFGEQLPTVFTDVFGKLAEDNNGGSYHSLLRLLDSATDANIGEITEIFNKRIEEASSGSRIFTLKEHSQTIGYPGSISFALNPPGPHGFRRPVVTRASINDTPHLMHSLTQEQAEEVLASFMDASKNQKTAMERAGEFYRVSVGTRILDESELAKRVSADTMEKIGHLALTATELVMDRYHLCMRILNSIGGAYAAYLEVVRKSAVVGEEVI